MKNNLLTLSLAALLLMGNKVSAQVPWHTYETRAWYPYCKTFSDLRASTDEEIIAGSFCMGTVVAVKNMGSLICSMEGSTTGIGLAAHKADYRTLMLVVLNFYEKNAQWLDIQKLSFTAFAALAQAYPCKK